MRLENKVAVVTGGGRGIGKGISLKLAQEGASVIIASTTLAPAQAVAEEIMQTGGRACAIQTDVSDLIP